MGCFSDLDRCVYDYLRGQSVLREVDTRFYRRRRRVILVTCADGEQILDLFLHFWIQLIGWLRLIVLLNFMMLPGRVRRVLARPLHAVGSIFGMVPVLHLMTPLGGPLRLVPTSRTIDPGSTVATDLMNDILKSVRLKNPIYSVVLMPHFACGLAAEVGYGPLEILDELVQAVEIVQTRLGSPVKVVAAIQVPVGRWFKRTYEVDVLRYLGRRDDLGIIARQCPQALTAAEA